eukprot:gene21436-32977_t
MAPDAAQKEKIRSKYEDLLESCFDDEVGAVEKLLVGPPPLPIDPTEEVFPPNTDTPLGEAAAGNAVNVARLLIEKGAQPNSRGSQNRTPLHRAVMNEHEEVIEVLLAGGADPRMLLPQQFEEVTDDEADDETPTGQPESDAPAEKPKKTKLVPREWDPEEIPVPEIIKRILRRWDIKKTIRGLQVDSRIVLTQMADTVADSNNDLRKGSKCALLIDPSENGRSFLKYRNVVLYDYSAEDSLNRREARGVSRTVKASAREETVRKNAELRESERRLLELEENPVKDVRYAITPADLREEVVRLRGLQEVTAKRVVDAEKKLARLLEEKQRVHQKVPQLTTVPRSQYDQVATVVEFYRSVLAGAVPSGPVLKPSPPPHPSEESAPHRPETPGSNRPSPTHKCPTSSRHQCQPSPTSPTPATPIINTGSRTCMLSGEICDQTTEASLGQKSNAVREKPPSQAPVSAAHFDYLDMTALKLTEPPERRPDLRQTGTAKSCGMVEKPAQAEEVGANDTRVASSPPVSCQPSVASFITVPGYVEGIRAHTVDRDGGNQPRDVAVGMVENPRTVVTVGKTGCPSGCETGDTINIYINAPARSHSAPSESFDPAPRSMKTAKLSLLQNQDQPPFPSSSSVRTDGSVAILQSSNTTIGITRKPAGMIKNSTTPNVANYSRTVSSFASCPELDDGGPVLVRSVSSTVDRRYPLAPAFRDETQSMGHPPLQEYNAAEWSPLGFFGPRPGTQQVSDMADQLLNHRTNTAPKAAEASQRPHISTFGGLPPIVTPSDSDLSHTRPKSLSPTHAPAQRAPAERDEGYFRSSVPARRGFRILKPLNGDDPTRGLRSISPVRRPRESQALPIEDQQADPVPDGLGRCESRSPARAFTRVLTSKEIPNVSRIFSSSTGLEASCRALQGAIDADVKLSKHLRSRTSLSSGKLVKADGHLIEEVAKRNRPNTLMKPAETQSGREEHVIISLDIKAKFAHQRCSKM